MPTVTPTFLGQVSGSLSAQARNIWDLQVYAGRVYIGQGDSVNNLAAGAVHLRYWDPAADAFGDAGSVQSEKIERFRVFGSTLYAPGYDPQSGNPVQYYIWDGTTLTRIEPFAAGSTHTWDYHEFFGGKRYIVSTGGLARYDPGGGAIWELIQSSTQGFAFEVGASLYICDGFIVRRVNTDDTYTNFTIADFAPAVTTNIDTNPFAFPYRDVVIGSATLTIWDRQYTTHLPYDEFVYITTAPGAASSVATPAGESPRDLASVSGVGYVLTSKDLGGGSWQNAVYSINAGFTAMTEVFNVILPTFARSFAYLNGGWYLGLGTDASHANSGDIYLVNLEASVPPHGAYTGGRAFVAV